MLNEQKTKITKTVEVAAKILEEKPHLKYSEAIKEAREKMATKNKNEED